MSNETSGSAVISKDETYRYSVDADIVETEPEWDLLPKTSAFIEPYRPFLAQIRTLAKENKSVVFDISTKTGMKEAKAHIYKFRQGRSAVEKVRKEEKQASLDYGRRIDAQAKEIISALETMMKVHQDPIDAIENAEKARVAAHQQHIENIKSFETYAEASTVSSEVIRAALDDLAELDPNRPDTDLQEFSEEALSEYGRIKRLLDSTMSNKIQIEALRAEVEAKEQEARDERIRQLAILETEERMKAEAPSHAAPAIPEKQNHHPSEDDRRQANNEALKVLTDKFPTIDQATAKAIIISIIREEIPHVRIQYT
jgi:hypothetical protein